MSLSPEVMIKFTRRAIGHFVTLIEIAVHLITCISGHICGEDMALVRLQ